MCRTIVTHHYACGHERRQYFANDPVCLPGPELCRRVGALRYHHFYWNQVTDWPSAMHETNYRYGNCDLCAAHCYYQSHDFGDSHPWATFLRTDALANNSGLAEHEERARAAEEAERSRRFGGWCPELLPTVTARLERFLWNLPEGVSLKQDSSSPLDGDVADHQLWRDGLVSHMILQGEVDGASLLMHILRHIQSLPLGGPAEWSGLVQRVAMACGQWRHFASNPEVFNCVEYLAQEMGYGLLFGNMERVAYQAVRDITARYSEARDIADAVLSWLQNSILAAEMAGQPAPELSSVLAGLTLNDAKPEPEPLSESYFE